MKNSMIKLNCRQGVISSNLGRPEASTTSWFFCLKLQHVRGEKYVLRLFSWAAVSHPDNPTVVTQSDVSRVSGWNWEEIHIMHQLKYDILLM